MTVDEVRAMTDEDLRIKAAELIGWKPPTSGREYPPDYIMDVEPNGTRWYRGDFGISIGNEFESLYMWHTDDGRVASLPPNYPSDWGAAMELFESAREERPWLFYDAMHDLSGGATMKRSGARALYLALSPRLITEAFVWAMEGYDE